LRQLGAVEGLDAAGGGVEGFEQLGRHGGGGGFDLGFGDAQAIGGDRFRSSDGVR